MGKERITPGRRIRLGQERITPAEDMTHACEGAKGSCHGGSADIQKAERTTLRGRSARKVGEKAKIALNGSGARMYNETQQPQQEQRQKQQQQH